MTMTDGYDEALSPSVVAIHVAPATRMPMRSVDMAIVERGRGIVGDRYHGSRHRHVTIQSAEELALAEELLGALIDPSATRRNVTVSHGQIPSAHDAIGRGAKDALRRRAGSVCRVLSSGTIEVGTAVFLDGRPPSIS
jgi:MOSC domain-containing protein YiiM